ncbi:MAG: carbamoyltransferase [Candidatus Hydrogenedentota bacterium]
MNILGISAFSHDSAACLTCDGAIVAAAKEEWFSRTTHEPCFPRNAIRYCLEEGGNSIKDVDYVVFHDKPLMKLKRFLKTEFSPSPKGLRYLHQQTPPRARKKLFPGAAIRRELGYSGEIVFTANHEAHAASAFFPSPYEEAAFLVLDGASEWAASAYGVGKGNRLEISKEIPFPHSPGLLCSVFAHYAGLRGHGAWDNLAALAPYGKPRYVDAIYQELIDVKPDGSIRMNTECFDYQAGVQGGNERVVELFGGPARETGKRITQREMDLARSAQTVMEEILLRMARHVREETGKEYLTLSGDMALNAKANARLLREGPFRDVWISPAPNDAGNALGSALFAYHQRLEAPRDTAAPEKTPRLSSVYAGPWFAVEAIESYLREERIPYERLPEDQLCDRVAGLLADEQIVGWFQGRMEFGPHPLGARGVLANAASRKMHSRLSRRNAFRPFAASVLAEHVSGYFELDRESPHLPLAIPVHRKRLRKLGKNEKKAKGLEKLRVIRSELPAITHVDNSARIHTVNREDNPLYHRLIERFHEMTGYPVIINSPFRVRGEPTVCSPLEAFRCFMRTDMDYLVMGPYLLDKKKQPPDLHDEMDTEREEIMSD